MSLRVVVESHAFGDDYDYAASPDDIEKLEDLIKSVKSSLSSLASKTSLDNKISSVEKKVKTAAESFAALKKEIIEKLDNGTWKKSFSEDIRNALQNIEKRYSEINAELDQKMSQLAQAGAIEEKMLKIFIEQEERFRTVIRESGKQLKSELDKKMESSDIIELLKVESQTITWEN